MCMNSLKRVSALFSQATENPRRGMPGLGFSGTLFILPEFFLSLTYTTETWEKLHKSQSSAFSRSQNAMEDTSENIPFEVHFILKLHITHLIHLIYVHNPTMCV